MSGVSGPGSVETLQAFNISVTDWQSVHQLINPFKIWRQTAQFQQVNLETYYYTFSVGRSMEQINFVLQIKVKT